MADWITVAQAGEIPAGKVKSVTVNGVKVAVCHVTGDGEAGYYAIEDVCTHDG
ncbi:MAG: Rieske 2Fe-2S domain-containing protein, partial [Chloroflexi bacterium]|nr:Rieske 2Fe-2S domain-containing protein [Chloroflexota bacterium]